MYVLNHEMFYFLFLLLLISLRIPFGNTLNQNAHYLERKQNLNRFSIEDSKLYILLLIGIILTEF